MFNLEYLERIDINRNKIRHNVNKCVNENEVCHGLSLCNLCINDDCDSLICQKTSFSEKLSTETPVVERVSTFEFSKVPTSLPTQLIKIESIEVLFLSQER